MSPVSPTRGRRAGAAQQPSRVTQRPLGNVGVARFGIRVHTDPHDRMAAPASMDSASKHASLSNNGLGAT